MTHVSLHESRNVGPCNLLEENCEILHWHRKLHGSMPTTRAWLHGQCTIVPIRCFKLVPGRDLYGSLQITRVYLHNPCICVSSLILLAFFRQRVTRVWAWFTRPVYFVSTAILCLLTSPSFPLHSHTLGLHPNT